MPKTPSEELASWLADRIPEVKQEFQNGYFEPIKNLMEDYPEKRVAIIETITEEDFNVLKKNVEHPHWEFGGVGGNHGQEDDGTHQYRVIDDNFVSMYELHPSPDRYQTCLNYINDIREKLGLTSLFSSKDLAEKVLESAKNSVMEKTMPDINQQIKETAQFWSKFFKGKLTSGLQKELEVPDGDLRVKILFGGLLEESMVNMRRNVVPVADRFEAILIEILQEIVQSPRKMQTRNYIDYDTCDLRSYSQSTSFIDLSYDYRPSLVLREALHRASLETGVDLADSSTLLFPSKASNWLVVEDKSYEVSSAYTKPNVAAKDYANCENLRNARIEAREKQLNEVVAHPASLPTMQEKILESAKNGAAHGLLRGSTQLLGDILKKKNISESAANIASQTTYYGGIFAMSFASQSRNVMDLNSCLNAMYRSAVETGQLMVVNAGLALFTKLLDSASHAASTQQWSWTSNILGKCSSLVQYGVFAKNAAEHGVATTAASVGAGLATQLIVEQAGKRLI